MTTPQLRIHLRIFLACHLLTLAIASDVVAQTLDSTAPRPVAQAIPLTTAPVMDGNVLDDPAWFGAEPITDFWQVQPNAGQAASQRTAVYFGYTETAIHIGIVAYDDEPLEEPQDEDIETPQQN